MPLSWLVLVALLLGAIVLAVRIARGDGLWPTWRIAVSAALAGVLVLAGAALHETRLRRRQAAAAERMAEVPRQDPPAVGGYTSSQACLPCHPDQHASWHRSFHRTMTQYASPATVKAPFTGVPPLPLKDGHLELERRGEELWVTRVSTSGERRPHRIGLVTGSHHLQLYWVPRAGAGNLQDLLPYGYLIQSGRWAPVKDTFLADPRIEWRFDVWNTQCLQCHATAGQPKASAGDRASSQVAELGIACESCHGPGQRHVEANRSPLRRYLTRRDGEGDATIVNPVRLGKAEQVDVCAQCHGVAATAAVEYDRFLDRGFSYRPGGKLAPRRQLLVPGEPAADLHLAALEKREPGFMRNHYWPDGLVRVVGREATAMVRSACHRRGELTCSSCHSLHEYREPDDQLSVVGSGDRACLQCHSGVRAGLDGHTRHRPESEGSRCYNCHMPHTAFGLLKAVRTHEIASPDVSTTLATGRPSACNLCHLDRSLAWTADHLARWYGQRTPELSDDDRDVAAGVGHALRGDAVQRALMAWAMGWQPARDASGDEWLPAYLTLALGDPYSVIRHVAERSLRRSPALAELRYDYAAPPARLAASVEAAVDLWKQTRRAVDPDKASRVLLAPDGTLDGPRVEAQLDRRDDRPVELKE